MSRLRIFDETAPEAPLLATSDLAAIAGELAKIGVAFEQWEAAQPIQPGDAPETILAAYKADIDRLVDANGFKTVDVVSIAPDNPQKEAMRAKFLDEHYHRAPHGGLFGKTPGTAWASATTRAVDEPTLAVALTTTVRRRVRKDGTLDVRGQAWQLDEGFLAGRRRHRRGRHDRRRRPVGRARPPPLRAASRRRHRRRQDPAQTTGTAPADRAIRSGRRAARPRRRPAAAPRPRGGLT